MPDSSCRRQSGFTLVELLVAIAVLSILTSLLLTAVQAAREAARRMRCVNNLKQIGLAIHAYQDVHGTTPLGNDWRPSPAWNGWPYNASLHVRILPFLEQTPLYERVDFRWRIYEAPNIPVVGSSLPFFHCPSDTGPQAAEFPAGDLSPFYDGRFRVGYTNYVWCGGTRYYYYGQPFNPVPPKAYHDGFFWEMNGGVRFADVTDGLSNTLLFSERARGRYPPEEQNWWGWWASGYGGDTGFGGLHPINASHRVQILSTVSDYTKMFSTASSFHRGGANFCFGDGSVRFLSETIESWDFDDDDVEQMWSSNVVTREPKVFQWLCTRNGGEAAGGF